MRISSGLSVVCGVLIFALNGAEISADSYTQCPVIGPTPPAQCGGRDSKWIPVSVLGKGTFCVLGPDICVADQLAACPGPSKQLPFGSKCVQLENDVYGCVPKISCEDGVLAATPGNLTLPSANCEAGCDIDTSIPRHCDGSDGWMPVSVVRSSTYCVKGPVCSGDAQALCPGPQRGLPFGSSCVRIPTGVFGCVKNTSCQKACTTNPSGTAQHDRDRCSTTDDSTSSTPITRAPEPSQPITTPSILPTTTPPSVTLTPTAVTTTPSAVTTTPPAVVTTPPADATTPSDVTTVSPPASTTVPSVTTSSPTDATTPPDVVTTSPPAATTVPSVSTVTPPIATTTVSPMTTPPSTAIDQPVSTSTQTDTPTNGDLPQDDDSTISPDDNNDSNVMLLDLSTDFIPDQNTEQTDTPSPTSPESIEIPVLGG